jgi:hypothetical protein
MKKVFGIKEAKAASEFATTGDQKRTVLAVVRMLGMRVNLVREVDKGITKLTNKGLRKQVKVEKLVKKTRVLELDTRIMGEEIGDLVNTREDWSV